MRNEIRDCACSPRRECTSTDINAENFRIPTSRESDYPAKAVAYSVTDNVTALLKTKMQYPMGQTSCNSHLPPKWLKYCSQCIHVSALFLEDRVSLYCVKLQGKVILFCSGMLVSLGGSQYIANWLLKTAINSINKHVDQNAAFEAIGRAQGLL